MKTSIISKKNKNKHQGEDEKLHFWDESNRLRSTVVDGGKLIHNIYDASGERTLKANSEYQGVFENGTPTDGGATLESYTTYPSAYMTIAPNAVYTNHYFAGTQRVASKPAGSATRFNIFTFEGSEQLKLKQLGDAQAIADSVDLGELALKDTDPGTIVPSVYYFHPDHLGSSTVITDGAGYAYQIFLNLPFGEILAEQRRSGSLNNPYKFNGKELDPETGLYYYSARYYDPRLSIFISVDPLAEQTMTPYQYTYQNPINLIDPTGMSGEDWYTDKNGNYKYNPNLTKENASSILKSNESYLGKSPSVDSYQLNANGSFANVETGKNYSGGQSVTLDSSFTITSHTSKGRAMVNYVTDNVVSPVIEGTQVIGYVFKGVLYDIPKMAIEERRAENLHVEMDVKIVSFENGKLTVKTYEDRNMNFEQKKEAFVKPGLSTLTAPFSITGNVIIDTVLGGEALNLAIDSIKEK